MSEVVRVPKPVAEKLDDEADELDVSRGAILLMWMRDYYDY